MRRVLAPGGRIVLYGKDWDTFVTDSGDPELTRTVVCKRAEQVPSPRAARQYCNLLLDAGFRVVTVEVHTGVFTDASFLPVFTPPRRGLLRARRDQSYAGGRVDRRSAGTRQADRLFAAVPIFIAAATNP
jgi:hypothetical protein